MALEASTHLLHPKDLGQTVRKSEGPGRAGRGQAEPVSPGACPKREGRSQLHSEQSSGFSMYPYPRCWVEHPLSEGRSQFALSAAVHAAPAHRRWAEGVAE